MALTKVSTAVVDLSGSTGALEIAKGATTTAVAPIGTLRANTTDHTMEVHTSTGWQALAEGGYVIIPLIVDYLVIAGGGGGGAAAYSSHATIGGGGAGGYRNSYDSEPSGGQSTSETALTLTPNVQYDLVVGTGGDGAAYQSNSSNPGTDSTFESITSIGGGGGASRNTDSTNRSGGSGGGGCYNRPKGYGTANQGFDGGGGAAILYLVGGGGGAGSIGTVGDSRNSSSLSCGGNGLTSQITGVGVVRAEGGGGSTNTANTSFPALKQGSGGYGGNEVANGATLRRGSDGVVILRYPASYSIQVGVGLTSAVDSTSVPGYKIETFTSGTGIITFS